MKQITINVPNWVPTAYDLYRLKKRIGKFFNPPRCKECGCRLKSTGLYLSKIVTGQHMSVADIVTDTFAIKTYENFCRKCMKKYIHSLNLKDGNCCICGKATKVMGYHFNRDTKLIITFLWHWWNYGEHCLDCIDDLLTTGNDTTDNRKIPII